MVNAPLEKGAHGSGVNNDGSTALQLATNGYEDVAGLLVAHG